MYELETWKQVSQRETQYFIDTHHHKHLRERIVLFLFLKIA